MLRARFGPPFSFQMEQSIVWLSYTERSCLIFKKPWPFVLKKRRRQHRCRFLKVLMDGTLPLSFIVVGIYCSRAADRQSSKGLVKGEMKSFLIIQAEVLAELYRISKHNTRTKNFSKFTLSVFIATEGNYTRFLNTPKYRQPQQYTLFLKEIKRRL